MTGAARLQALSGEPRAAYGSQLTAFHSKWNIRATKTAAQGYTFCRPVSCSTHLIYQLLCLLRSAVMGCLQRCVRIHGRNSKLRISQCS
jgi:hypothetical protein